MKRRRFKGAALWNSRDGSVNVFLIGITAALFLCMAVLIDFARIAAFERLAESAVYSGVRSALSAYDGTLYERYGLFARGGTDSGEIFNRVVTAAMKPENTDRGLKLLRTDMTSGEVSPGDTLGLHAVLERQILEEMKYKAPIDFTLELAERFQVISPGLKEAAHAADTMKRLQELFDSRQRHLEEALRNQKEAAAAAASSGMAALIPYPSGSGGGNTAAAAASGYGNYVAWVRAEAERRAREAEWQRQTEEVLRQWQAACGGGASGTDNGCASPPVIPPPDLGPSYAAEIAAYERSARETAAGLMQAARTAADKHARAIAAARQAVDAAAADNERMADMLRTAGQSGAGNPAAAEDGTGQAAGEIRSILDDASRLVLDADWFEDYRRELAGQDAAAAGLQPQAGLFESAAAQALASPDTRNASALEAAVDKLFRGYQAYASQYSGADGAGSGNVIAARGQAIAELNAADHQRKQFERQSEAKRGEAARLLLQIAQLPYDEEAAKEFEQVRKRYEASLTLNEASSSPSGGSNAGLNDESGEYAKNAAGEAAGLFGLVESVSADLRDELYLNEYAASRFEHFRPQNLSGLVSQTSSGTGGSTGGTNGGNAGDLLLSVSNQEVEYILYGIHRPAGNIAAAYGEIFAVRTAIRLMEGLVECRTFGHPLVVFAAAVAYSLEHALMDMTELINTGKTKLSKWLKIDITYRDYLRLFLLIHGSKAEKLARVAALIEHSTGYRLSEMPTSLTGRADVSVNLWFLPGVMKMLASGGILQGKVVGGRYESTVAAGSSY
jgi:hypothetical protein